ncbi:hypothetical protein ACO0SA_002036 [Hanseniaspora valbyensis]
MLLSVNTSYDDNSVDQLLLDLFENGIYNIENIFSLNNLLNHQNSKFILENVLGDYLTGKDILKPNLNNNIDFSLSIDNKINLNKLIIFFRDKDYDRLYGFVDKLANKNTFISQNLAIKYLQIYSLYLLWDDKTSVLSILDDNLIVGSDFNEDNIVSNKMEDGSSLQELRVIKTISIPVVVDLPFILHEIDHTIDLNYNSDDDFALSLLYYLKGLILNKQNNKKKAIEALTNSLKKNPYNWNAYKEMSSCIDRVEEVSILLEYISKEIQYTLLFEFFQIECWASFFQTSNRNIYIDKLTQLLSIFPTSKYLIIKNASLAFELKDLVQSEFLFDSLIQLDPYSIETMDLYSNILYVTGNLPKLKSLLTKAKIINEFSSECQTISGNFQSLIKNHEKAILHFKRAIKVTSNDSQQKSKLYTLIGHEFIELGNHHAAISSYRRASSLDSRNYAAWMGLGLGYDILKQYQFSVYYYQKCVSIKMDDYRGWLSLGECYYKLEKWNQAINAFTRSYENSFTRNKKVICAEKIINLYLKIDDLNGARNWNIELTLNTTEDDYYINACKWLCKNAIDNLKNENEARHYWKMLKQAGVILEQYMFLDDEKLD